jgi:hypothetical protein
MASVCGASLFGSTSQYIKVGNGEFIAIEGANTRDRLLVSDLRMPYKQLLKSRVILKAGQVNYLLNHLGLGDNATFLAIKAVYDNKSVIEEDNYVNWSFYDDLTKVYSFAQMMVLTGNSSNRIKQLYLTNPNVNYTVTLDVMIGVIDDSYNFFNDNVNQSGTSFTGLEYTDIDTYIVGESIVIYDKSSPVRPLIYLQLVNIESIQKSGQILIIDDSSLGTIFLQFLTESDAYQAQSLLNYVLENPNVDISNISPLADEVDPIVYFNEKAGATGSYIDFNGSTSSVPYATSDGFTFSTSISLLDFGTASGTLLDKSHLIYLMIDYIEDNRDGYMTMLPSNLVITGTSGVVNSITSVGTYSVTFDFSDIAQNYLDGVIINLDVTN